MAQASRADAAAAAPPGEEQKARLASLGGVVTDAAVPEGHKGLHGFLYGEGGAEEHDSRGYVFRHVRPAAAHAADAFRQIFSHVPSHAAGRHAQLSTFVAPSKTGAMPRLTLTQSAALMSVW